MADTKKRLLSGVKPTGSLHIGNYFGALQQFVVLQEEYEGLYMIADYHAYTNAHLQRNPDELRAYILDVAIDYLAIGLDPLKGTLFRQSDIGEHTEAAWIFECLTTMPYLMRAHAFKDAEAKNKEINAGTFNYPLLMAADILLYDAHVVPVGKDQKQHLEFARDTAEKFNDLYGKTFTVPEPLIIEDVQTIPGTDGQKMSKSYNNTIPLFAEDDEIEKAVMSIVTDSKSPEEPKNTEGDTLFALHKLFSKDQIADLEKRYRDGGIGYKESKEILIENIKAFIGPMREKRKDIAANKGEVERILHNGGEIARSHAREKMVEVRHKIGLR